MNYPGTHQHRSSSTPEHVPDSLPAPADVSQAHGQHAVPPFRRCIQHVSLVLYPTQGLLGRVRWTFLLCTLFGFVVFVPTLFFAASTPRPTRALGALALLGPYAGWIRGYRRGSFSGVALGYESVMLSLITFATRAPQLVLGMLYCGLYFRALDGPVRRVGLLWLIYLNIYLLAAAMWSPTRFASAAVLGQIPGFVVAVSLMAMLQLVLTKHEQALDHACCLEIQLAHQAFHDPLTTLPNRALFMQRLQQARACQARLPGGRTLFVSINLAAPQFRQPQLIHDIAQTLQETGLNPAALHLELLESVAMKPVEASITRLRMLKQLRVQLATDDCGTGHSAMRSLARFPVNILKIDSMFIDALGTSAEDTAIVRAVIAFAKVLNLPLWLKESKRLNSSRNSKRGAVNGRKASILPNLWARKRVMPC